MFKLVLSKKESDTMTVTLYFQNLIVNEIISATIILIFSLRAYPDLDFHECTSDLHQSSDNQQHPLNDKQVFTSLNLFPNRSPYFFSVKR